MRRIPGEGEYCGECPCKGRVMAHANCNAYPNTHGNPVWLDYVPFSEPREFKRLPRCLKDKPQLLTEADREQIYANGFIDGREQKEIEK